MNKLIRKITLSGVTLGVAALSVTTSTFAWFTTNSEAKASNVSGKVDSSGNNMLIKTIKAWDGQSYEEGETSTTASGSNVWGGFASTVTLTPKTDVKLKPVTYVKNNTSNNANTGDATESSATAGTNETATNTLQDGFYTAKDKTNGDFTQAATEKDYLHYQVIFGLSGLATGNDITNKVTLTADNFTSTKNGSQYLLVDAGDNAKAGSTVTVNLLDVLSMRVQSTIINSSDINLETYGLKSSDVPGSSDTYKITANNYSYRYRAESESSNSDALTYYNKVYNTNVQRPSPDTERGYQTTSPTTLVTSSETNGAATETANAITLFTISGNATAYVLCDIYFYIDGWDKECFNAIGGLTLDSGTLNFNLTTN